MIIKKLKQPYVIAYLFTGILLGPYGLDLIKDTHNLERLGEIGVILLLFFAWYFLDCALDFFETKLVQVIYSWSYCLSFCHWK